MNTTEKNWNCWRDEINRRQDSGEGLEFTLEGFANSLGLPSSCQDLYDFLELLVESKEIRKVETYRCPRCDYIFPLGASKPISACARCLVDYDEQGEEVINTIFYKLPGDYSRDIRWVIVIHGMNSRAPWQEEFSWQIANRLRYSAPVLIYKYGWATIEVLFKPCHRRLARELGERIRIAINQADQSKRPISPDIVAHSFGTHLFSLILEDPYFKDLKFGRVINAGSIVRPDFDWDSLIAEKRLEAILNHVAEKDGAVPFAEYAIPGSGPSGKIGFLSKKAINVQNDSFGHSDFFKAENLHSLISDGGLWNSFLTCPLARFKPDKSFNPRVKWRPLTWPVRTFLKVFFFIIYCLGWPFSWVRRKFDP